jgi:hypothetical protein
LVPRDFKIDSQIWRKPPSLPGNLNGQLLLLGSAAMDVLKQSGECLAGRISCLKLGPFDALEVATAKLEPPWTM